MLDQYFRVALCGPLRCASGRQVRSHPGDVALSLKPTSCTGGEREHAPVSLAFRDSFEARNEAFSALPSLVIRVRDDAGDLGVVVVAIKGCAGDDHAVEFDDVKVFDVELDALARARQQETGSNERRGEFDDAGGIFERRWAQALRGMLGDLRAAAIAGEEFHDEVAVAGVADHVPAPNA